MAKQKVRVAFITYPSLYSLIMLNYWLRKPKTYPVVAILLSDFDFKVKGKELPFLAVVARVIKQSGWQYALYEFFVTYLSGILINLWNFFRVVIGKERKIFTFEQLSKKHSIPIFRSKDFGDEQTLNFLKNVNATLIVSGYNNQIIKKNLIKFPEFGCVGIHPAFLPDFRGADPVFAALYSNVKETGVTIHYIDGKIDSGPIIAQDKSRIRMEDSLFSLNIRLWMHGAKILSYVIKQISEGKVNAKKQNYRLTKYKYESFPAKQKIRDFLKRKKSLFTFKDIQNILK
ncbi:MAG: formyltransferase family protein [Candidatus Omnitrophota bacterium]